MDWFDLPPRGEEENAEGVMPAYFVNDKGEVHYNGDLTVEIANELASDSRIKKLVLNGLTSLDEGRAEALAKSTSLEGLFLQDLKSLDEGPAAALATSRTLELLDVSRVESLETDTAAALANCKNLKVLSLDRVTLDQGTAEALANSKSLQKLECRNLNKDRVEDLAKSESLQELHVYGLESLDQGTAEALAKWANLKSLSLFHVKDLKTDIAAALAKSKSLQQLDFSSLESLKTDTAAALATSTSLKSLSLYEVKDLETDTAAALATSKSLEVLRCFRLSRLEPDTAAALATSTSLKVLVLDSLESLETDTVAALAKSTSLKRVFFNFQQSHYVFNEDTEMVEEVTEDMIVSEELISPQVQQSLHPQEVQVEEVSSDPWSLNLTRKQRLAFGRRAENAHQILEFKQAADLALAEIVKSANADGIDVFLENYIAYLNNIDRDDEAELSDQQAILVQWAYYFNINSDVGTPAFEKDLTRKLRICLMEELGEPEIDMDPVYESSTFAEHKDSFKARVYEQVMQKYAGEQLSDPDVRSKISKEITMAMMQERVNLIETQFEKTQKMKHAWESIKKCKSLIVPGVMTAALASSAVFGGTTAIPWLLGFGANVAWTGLPYLVTLLCQDPTFALTTGAIYSGAKLMQAVRKISLPPFFKKDAEDATTTTANQSAMNVLRFGGRLAVGTGGKMSVHNVNSAQPGQSLKVRKLESQWEKQRKATLKASTKSIRTQMTSGESRSACILNAIDSAYSASNLGDIHKLKGDNVIPELAAFGSSTALFGLPSLTTHIGKKMFA